MFNNDQSSLFLYCCEDIKLHHSGSDTVPLNKVNLIQHYVTWCSNEINMFPPTTFDGLIILQELQGYIGESNLDVFDPSTNKG